MSVGVKLLRQCALPARWQCTAVLTNISSLLSPSEVGSLTSRHMFVSLQTALQAHAAGTSERTFYLLCEKDMIDVVEVVVQ